MNSTAALGEAKRLAMVAEEEEVRDTAAGSSSSSSVESQLKARVQELFAVYVASGMNANAAAAKALSVAKAELGEKNKTK